MALSTRKNQDDSKNPGIADYEKKFGFNPYAGNERFDQKTKNTFGPQDVKDAEANPKADWNNNVSEKDEPIRKGFRLFKKKGPTISIIALLTCGIGAFGLLGGASLLPQAILANTVNTYNSQETSFTIRTNRLIANKLSDTATEGSCSIEKIACRFSRPSNYFLTQLEKNGISALDKEGNVIVKKTLWPNTRPAKYTYKNSAGEQIEVKAKDFYSKIIKDAEFRAKFHTAAKTRFTTLSDNFFKKIKTKFKLNLSNKLSSATDESSLKSAINEDVVLNENGAKAAASEGDDAVKSVAKEIISEEGEEAVEKLAKTGKGNAVGLVAGAVCLITDVPGLITSAARSFQMTQVIKYSSLIIGAIGAIKAGDASDGESSALLSLLTTNVNGSSAMDSYGMKSIMNGQKTPTSDNYKKFVPGGSVIATLGAVVAIMSSSIKTNACKVMTDPVTGVAIDAVASETGIGITVAAANIALGYGLGWVIDAVLPSVIDAVVGVLPMDNILKFFYGDLTENLSGEDVGDAYASGASNLMGQTASAGGNVPLTVDEAVAYENLTNEVQLAYAEEDQSTLSPLDASSSNTFLGALVQNVYPYIYNLLSSSGSILSNIISSISSIVTGSFSTLTKPLTTSADSTAAEYQLCEDPSILNNDIAAGPYCNIIYGIPTEYLDEDPIDVVNSLIASGDIDEETGEATTKNEDSTTVESYASWLNLCTDGSTDQAKYCKISDQKTAEYALYTIDHRIQQSLDNEE